MNEQQIQDFHKEVGEMIDKNGHMVMSIMADEENGAPAFAYTVGCHPRLGFEFIVSGIPHRTAQVLLNVLVNHVKENKGFELNTPIEGIIVGFPVYIVECNSARVLRDYALQVARRYGDYVKIYQLLLPDPNRVFPAPYSAGQVYDQKAFPQEYFGAPEAGTAYRVPVKDDSSRLR